MRLRGCDVRLQCVCMCVRACVRACAWGVVRSLVWDPPGWGVGRIGANQGRGGAGRVVLWTVGLQGAGGVAELRPRDSDRDPLRPGLVTLVVFGVQ